MQGPKVFARVSYELPRWRWHCSPQPCNVHGVCEPRARRRKDTNSRHAAQVHARDKCWRHDERCQIDGRCPVDSSLERGRKGEANAAAAAAAAAVYQRMGKEIGSARGVKVSEERPFRKRGNSGGARLVARSFARCARSRWKGEPHQARRLRNTHCQALRGREERWVKENKALKQVRGRSACSTKERAPKRVSNANHTPIAISGNLCRSCCNELRHHRLPRA